MQGWTRQRSGRGFRYVDDDGNALPADQVERLKALAIPPAWTDLWICPVENGHLQAVGTDDAGRRQYLYHPQWRERRDRSKFDRVTSAAALLPRVRRQVSRDLELAGMPLERACATAVRLLDVGYFRIGNDAYTDAHGSFGLTTLEHRHVRRRAGALVFTFTGKSGIAHRVEVDDPPAIESLDRMRSRRGSTRLLAHRGPVAEQRRGAWRDLTSSDVNAYLHDLFDGDFTAKDFRTWHAGVIAAEVLATTDEPVDTAAARARAVRQAVLEVAAYLGNTPAVARKSYIDPRIIDLHAAGTTIGEVASRRFRSATARQTALESALLDLLG
ncbi:DNA topoisomerase IB [Aestuariimicrobium soli]|uniref:DNA topoisomerase IB n=1 Tax=Aestuariimicrobium soli TaxID=2035834 RepID=UPI003EBD3E40